MRSSGWGGNEQRKGDFVGLASNLFSWKKKCLLIAAARLCGSLRLTNGSFHTTQGEKRSTASVFISGLSGAADDVLQTPLTVFTDALEDSQAVRSNNTALVSAV